MLALFSAKCLGVKRELKQNRNFDTRTSQLGKTINLPLKVVDAKVEEIRRRRGEDSKANKKVTPIYENRKQTRT
jgi:hypothetical protein